MDYLKAAKKLKEEIIENRRWLHQHPELGFDLDHTVSFVKEKLIEMGYEPQDCGNHGVVAIVGGKKPGKCILLRADMDALPMKEESGLPFASISNDKAHTCGHDTHTAMLLGAAKILKEMEAEISGTVKFMFQPAEELASGAKDMVDNGILDNPKVDAAIGGHIMACYPKGMILYNYGSLSTSCDFIQITVHGKSAHGSTPHVAIDPINIASHIIINLQALNAREIPATEAAVFTIGKFQAGTAPNQIPDTAILQGSLRTFSPSIRKQMLKRIDEISYQTAAMYGGTAEVAVPMGIGSVVLEKGIVDCMGRAIKEVAEENLIIDKCEKLPFSEDFSFVSDKVPSSFFLLGACPEGSEPISQHNSKVVFDEDILPVGTAIYAAAAVKWLEEASSDE